MKIVISGSDANAMVAAIQFKREGHEVEVLEGKALGGVSSLLPSCPLAPEVASSLDMGVSLQIVGRVGVASSGETVTMKLRELSGDATERDKARWRDFVKVLNNASELWRGLFQEGGDVVARWREFGRRQSMEVLRLPWQSLSVLLDDWFESDVLKATLAAAALRGTRQGPFSPGSAFLLLQRWARGEVFGRSKTTLEQLRDLATEAGVEFRADSLTGIARSVGIVKNFKTAEGAEVQADIYLTTEDPLATLDTRIGIGKADPDHAEIAQFWDCRSATTVAQCEASEKWEGAMVNFADSLEALEKAYDPTKFGGFSEAPFAEFDSQSGLLYVQQLDGDGAADAVKALCEAHELGEVKWVKTPTELASEFEVTGGHLFGGEKSLWQSYGLRERLRNPLPNLYLCGASTGPGDYSGVSGLMAARLVGSLALA